ncbi:MAG TPA: ATP-binding protein [Flavobacteriales bacterium]|jgi:signal transduction histidine kinase|nr:HAMP domain-containing protein [Flavobacteriales bacterium]MBK7103062.1 HAMP domain-containing protein [Flavobacteriales bacterium]MBK7113837.1 HAMP domain-containing protein [Flavobacteriales bacterium]MBK7620785.1 HAMP domain-containing protein [Flavobacteriales bacterium]MBK8531150.1 HAMP domain-containing protein [Flavobacteriales bacterium]
MNIRTRLALQFLVLVSLIVGVAFVVVYTRAAEFRTEEFHDRMRSRGESTANLLLDVAEVDDRLLRKIEQNSPVRLINEGLSIYDDHNALLIHLGEDHALLRITPALLDSIRQQGELERITTERELLAFHVRSPKSGFVAVISGQDLYGRRKLQDQARVMLVTFLVGLVLIFFISRTFARRALSPLQRLILDLRSITASDLSRRTDPGTGTDEIAQVAASFNDLLGRLEAAFGTQKNFIANASHEMRTPLTAISGQLEVLLLKERSGEDYRNALKSVVEDMHALNRLNDRLLMMAQTDAASITFAPVRLDELIWAARTEVLRTKTFNQVIVTIEGFEEASDLTVNGNEVLLRCMIVNLMENACKYSGDHQALVTLRGKGERVTLDVEDRGIGIDPVDHHRIFEQFFRARNSAGTKGHGIGLSLVKRIVELHGGVIHVESKRGEGARFVITFRKFVDAE